MRAEAWPGERVLMRRVRRRLRWYRVRRWALAWWPVLLASGLGAATLAWFAREVSR